MSHVFISYLHERKSEVREVVEQLRSSGMKVWIDEDMLLPGDLWQTVIRQGIEGGAFFLAFWSKEYESKQKTFFNREIFLAIEQLQLRPLDRRWFIPVRLDDVAIPDYDIGGGQTLRSLQYVDLFRNKKVGIERIILALKQKTSQIAQYEAQSGEDVPGDTRPVSVNRTIITESSITLIRETQSSRSNIDIEIKITGKDYSRHLTLCNGGVERLSVPQGAYEVHAMYHHHYPKDPWVRGDYGGTAIGESEKISIDIRGESNIVVRCGFVGGFDSFIQAWKVIKKDVFLKVDVVR